MAASSGTIRPKCILNKFRSLTSHRHLLCTSRIHRTQHRFITNTLTDQYRGRNSLYHHHIYSFCAQSKEQKDDSSLESDHSDDEYEYEYESEYEDDAEFENEDQDDQAIKSKEDQNDENDEMESEYEYETDDEFENDHNNQSESRETFSETVSTENQQNVENSVNFDFDSVSQEMLAALWLNLPESGRIEGKPVEHFISPLILKPLEVLDDEIHNKFSLMHQDMDNLWKMAYRVPMENESELRDIIALAFDKMNVYCHYIEHHFGLRHSPMHYLMRQIRVDHGTIVFLVTRKILYFKYPEWVQGDNWAREEMSEHNRRKFLISHELGIGLEELESKHIESIEGGDMDSTESEKQIEDSMDSGQQATE